MKRILSALSIAILSIGLTVVGVSASAAAVSTTPNPYTCIQTPTFSYTYDGGATGTVTVTKSGVKSGTLCTPLAVRATTWNYSLPTNGQNPSWPQKLAGFNDVSVDSIGVFSYAAPVVATCKQNDIYASFSGFDDLKLPAVLTGAGVDEPTFLSGVLYGLGADMTPTYHSDPSIGCTPTPPQTCSAGITTTLSTDLAPAGWTFGETRANGHNVYVASGLHVSTDGASDAGPRTDGGSGNWNTDKAAGYHAVDLPLSAVGTPALDYTPTSAGSSLPGLQLTIDKDGDGGYDGNLVYEPSLFGAGNWWASHNLGVVSATPAPNPSYQLSFGTLADFEAAWPNAKITAVGYSLGSGALGDGIVKSVSIGCDKYTFAAGSVLPSTIEVTLANDPTVTPEVCSDSEDGGVVSGFITVEGVTGVSYLIHNNADADVVANDITVASGDTVVPAGSYTVTASALPGFTLTSDVTRFTPLVVGAAPADCQLPTHAFFTADASGVNPTCTNGVATGGYIQVDPAAGLDYFIGTTKLTAATTPVFPGTYVVRAEVTNPGDTIDPASNPISIVIAPLAASCADLATLALHDGQVLDSGTLAFTGATDTGWFIGLATLLMILGAALASARGLRVRTRDEN